DGSAIASRLTPAAAVSPCPESIGSRVTWAGAEARKATTVVLDPRSAASRSTGSPRSISWCPEPIPLERTSATDPYSTAPAGVRWRRDGSAGTGVTVCVPHRGVVGAQRLGPGGTERLDVPLRDPFPGGARHGLPRLRRAQREDPVPGLLDRRGDQVVAEELVHALPVPEDGGRSRGHALRRGEVEALELVDAGGQDGADPAQPGGDVGAEIVEDDMVPQPRIRPETIEEVEVEMALGGLVPLIRVFPRHASLQVQHVALVDLEQRAEQIQGPVRALPEGDEPEQAEVELGAGEFGAVQIERVQRVGDDAG